MSLIADSLKKAIKEKSAPKWEANRETNPVGNREPLKRPGLAIVFRVLFLIVLPAAIFVYLISIGAFALKKTPVTQKPDVPVTIPSGKAKVSPRQMAAPGASLDQTIEVPATKPTEKSSLQEEIAQKKKAVVPKPTATIRAPEEPPSSKKEETVFKKVIPPYPSKKKAGKPEAAINEIPNEKAASLPSPDLKPASPVTPKIPPVVVEKKIVTAPPVEPTEKPVAEAKTVLEKKAVVPEGPAGHPLQTFGDADRAGGVPAHPRPRRDPGPLSAWTWTSSRSGRTFRSSRASGLPGRFGGCARIRCRRR